MRTVPITDYRQVFRALPAPLSLKAPLRLAQVELLDVAALPKPFGGAVHRFAKRRGGLDHSSVREELAVDVTDRPIPAFVVVKRRFIPFEKIDPVRAQIYRQPLLHRRSRNDARRRRTGSSRVSMGRSTPTRGRCELVAA